MYVDPDGQAIDEAGNTVNNTIPGLPGVSKGDITPINTWIAMGSIGEAGVLGIRSILPKVSSFFKGTETAANSLKTVASNGPSTVQDLVGFARTNQIADKNLQGGANFVKGTAEDAKGMFDVVTDGWKTVYDKGGVLTKQSADKSYQLTFRTVSNSAKDVKLKTGNTVNAIIDVAKNNGKGGFKDVNSVKGGIKFITK